MRSVLFRRLVEPQTIQIAFEQSIFLINLKRHPQSRRYTLRVHGTRREVVLTMPLRGSIRQAREFAQKHAAWIDARLRRLPEAAPFVDGMTVPLRGIPHRIVHQPRSRGTVWVEIAGDERLLCVAGDEAHVSRRLRDYFKREAQRDLVVATRRYAEALDVKVRRITIRDQTSRWGSCSSTGVLSFSWRLILAPAFVLDAIAAHEVAHLIEMNHSPRFWRLLKKLCPATVEAKRWLDGHGGALHRYGLESVAAESEKSC
jgi:predicted metal-dependent hydrolase